MMPNFANTDTVCERRNTIEFLRPRATNIEIA